MHTLSSLELLIQQSVGRCDAHSGLWRRQLFRSIRHFSMGPTLKQGWQGRKSQPLFYLRPTIRRRIDHDDRVKTARATPSQNK
ncbi:hypothetical protein GCK32_007051, partial [Trichostrongylus colubriformis]